MNAYKLCDPNCLCCPQNMKNPGKVYYNRQRIGKPSPFAKVDLLASHEEMC